MGKPKIQIKNFSGMGNGTYYLDRMESQKISGQDILTPGFYSTPYVNEDDTGFTGLGTVNDFAGLSLGSSVALNNIVLAIDNNTIWGFNTFSIANNLGSMNVIGNTGSGTDAISASTYPGMIITTNNNILYTSSNHLGRGSLGEATGGSTTTLIDTATDFTDDMGITTAAGKNQVFNVTNGEVYTVTGVSTTTNTNDTITFDTTTTAAAEDIYIAFQNDFQKYDTSLSRDVQFVGQVSPSSWIRQIVLLGDEYWSLNGNYVASLNIDESTWSATAKQLPSQHQAVCFDENNGKLLVGGDYRGSGKLMMWDTYSDGWNSILDIDSVPDSIKAYGSGWIVIAQSRVYYTDGYQIKIMSSVPDMDTFGEAFNAHYNGLEIIGNDIIISADPDRFNRAKTGVWIYNTEKGWTYTPFTKDAGKIYTGSAGALKKVLTGSFYEIFTSSHDNTSASDRDVINKIRQGSGTNYSAMFYVKLPEKMKINNLELNLSSTYNDYADSDGTVDVSVSYGDGKDTLWDYAQTSASGSTKSSIINATGTIYAATVGQEIMPLDGDTGGEKSWITAITNAGTATETWAISPDLSADPEANINIGVMNLNLSETKTISTNAIPNNLTYPVSDFYSDNLWIEVDFQNKTGTYTLDLHSINIH